MLISLSSFSKKGQHDSQVDTNRPDEKIISFTSKDAIFFFMFSNIQMHFCSNSSIFRIMLHQLLSTRRSQIVKQRHSHPISPLVCQYQYYINYPPNTKAAKRQEFKGANAHESTITRCQVKPIYT